MRCEPAERKWLRRSVRNATAVVAALATSLLPLASAAQPSSQGNPVHMTSRSPASGASVPYNPAPLGAMWPSLQAFRMPGSDSGAALPGYSFDWEAEAWHFDLSWKRMAPYVLTSTELVALLGVNMAAYWAAPGWNAPDWELSWDWKSWHRKTVTFEGIALDTNVFETNAVMHPIAGTLFYTASRGSTLPIWQSFLFAATASTVWEFVAEYREKVSLNDLIVTPMGGLTIGEPLHQMSRFFGRGEPGARNQLFSLLFSPFREVNSHILPGHGENRASAFDRFGFPADVWHSFDVYAGAGATTAWNRSQQREATIGLRAELIGVPEYGRPGRASRTLSDGNFTKLALEASFIQGGLYELDFSSKVALAGHYWQDVRGSPPDALYGRSVFVGASSAFDYQMHDWHPHYRDKIGVVNLIGPTLDLTLYHGKWKVRAAADAYADFGSVRTPVISDYIEKYGKAGIKSVLAAKEYYFATGVTFRPRLSVQYGNFEIVGETALDYFHSIQGQDRNQSRVSNDFELNDSRFAYSASLRYRLPANGALGTGQGQVPWVRIEHLTRSGRIGVMSANLSETRYQAGISLVF